MRGHCGDLYRTAFHRVFGITDGKRIFGAAADLWYGGGNPNVIPYGSLMYITSADGRFVYGYAYAADTGTAMMTGSAFIDLYYETYSESVDNAVIAVNVYVLDSDTTAKYKEENDAILKADNTPGL